MVVVGIEYQINIRIFKTTFERIFEYIRIFGGLFVKNIYIAKMSVYNTPNTHMQT